MIRSQYVWLKRIGKFRLLLKGLLWILKPQYKQASKTLLLMSSGRY